ncbi:PAS domain-containing sensor histidine kinase [Argonema antarcticum]|uniref:PAS domain-containing sensor histidine kinase n=1 Tax=Argonema antarcticum TaxID=2942763 RepID=UPI0020137F54|nr:PAS domain-containing sensor histidine kinase [Argonema antarcticum]MCL1474398.1 PAS domain-containing sensor histidine kinase [Argonema antarcticum A004/B2]
MSWNVEHEVYRLNSLENTPTFGSSVSTKREILRQTVLETETKYRSIFENAPVGIFQATNNGKYLIANPALARIYGYESPSELMASVTNIKEQLYVDPNRHIDLINLLQERNVVYRFESQIYRKDGSAIWISENVRAIYDSNGQLLSYEGSVEEITERKYSEEMMQAKLAKEKEINEMKSRFLSMVCHDLRTFLTIIITTSDLLKLHGNKFTAKNRGQYFEKITSTVKSMNELLEGFLAISKAECGKKTTRIAPFELQSFCKSIWQDVQTITNTTHRLAFINTCQNVTLVSDQTLLRQILMNLLLNAVKYSPQDSTIYFDLSCQKNQITFCIKDEGVGIPQEDREHLFEVFHRASNVLNFSGTGLGMAIVKRGVELYGGKILVESEVGCGTTFTVILPTICTKLPMSEWDNKIFCVCEESHHSHHNCNH